jgi:hypothetical protein
LDPMYVKSSTVSMASSPILKASVVLLFTRWSLVFEMMILRPSLGSLEDRPISAAYCRRLALT